MTPDELLKQWRAERKAECKWCADGVSIKEHPEYAGDWYHINQDGIWVADCTAPTLEAFAAARITDLETKAEAWRCFHCGFETSNPQEAEAHFGERDDAAEFTPTCTWWSKLTQEERLREHHDLRQQFIDEREENSLLRTKIEGLEFRVEGQLSEIKSFAPFRSCGSVNEIFHVYDSMEGRALAAEERVSELETANRELREDKGRLDWLSEQRRNGDPEISVGGPWVYNLETRITTGRWKIYRAVRATDGGWQEQAVSSHETLREAIDAARNAKEAG